MTVFAKADTDIAKQFASKNVHISAAFCENLTTQRYCELIAVLTLNSRQSILLIMSLIRIIINQTTIQQIIIKVL